MGLDCPHCAARVTDLLFNRLPERHADAELEVGAVVGADLELEEEPLAVLESAEEIESGLRIIAGTADLIHVDRRATAGVETPRTGALRKLPRELEIECGERDVVPEAHLDIGSENEPLI